MDDRLMNMRPILRSAFAAMAAVTLVACTSDAGVEVTAPQGADGPSSARWERLPDPPLQPRQGAAIAWSGEEVMVFGGTTFLCPPGAACAGPEDDPRLRDGAVFDPASEEWRTVADAPVPVSGHASTAELDSDIYVLTTRWPPEDDRPVLLRYRVPQDTWDSYDVPLARHVSGLLATDDRLVAYPSTDELGELPDLVFNPSDASWNELPADPLGPSFGRHLAWDGQNLHLFAKDLVPNPGGESGPSFIQAAVLEAERWVELPDSDTIGFGPVISDGDRLVGSRLGCADGGEVNGYGRCIPYGAVFDTAERSWSSLPNPPASGEDVFSSGALTSQEVVLTSTGNPMLDLRTDSWFEVPEIDSDLDENERGPNRTMRGAGPYGFAFGGVHWTSGTAEGRLLGDAWIWRPLGPRA